MNSAALPPLSQSPTPKGGGNHRRYHHKYHRRQMTRSADNVLSIRSHSPMPMTSPPPPSSSSSSPYGHALCPVCQYIVTPALGNVVTLECGHLIHNAPCQHEWLHRMQPTQRTECPICRTHLPSLDVVRPGGIYEVPYVAVLAAASRSSPSIVAATDIFFNMVRAASPPPKS